MSDIVFNVAKGRAVELANRVKSGDPAAARLYAIPVDRAAVTDATLRDCADFAAVIAAGVTVRRWWHRRRDRQERVLREEMAALRDSLHERLDETTGALGQRLDLLHDDLREVRASQLAHLEAHVEGLT